MMVVNRETVRSVIIVLAGLAVVGLLSLMFGSMASKTHKVSPTEALMVEASFASGQVTEQQAEDRTERVQTCREDVKEISEAVEEANKKGKSAASVTDLEQDGFLDETPRLAPVLVYTLEVSQGRPTGLVLVNGLPAPLACES